MQRRIPVVAQLLVASCLRLLATIISFNQSPWSPSDEFDKGNQAVCIGGTGKKSKVANILWPLKLAISINRVQFVLFLSQCANKTLW